MENLHTGSPHSEDRPTQESLSDYVNRMETDENLKILAQKLAGDLKKPASGEEGDISTPDLSFARFEERRKRRERQ